MPKKEQIDPATKKPLSVSDDDLFPNIEKYFEEQRKKWDRPDEDDYQPPGEQPLND